MEFDEMLNAYMRYLNCSAKKLAEASGLSPAVISRYRNGERIPSTDSPQFLLLCQGIASIAGEQDTPKITLESVRSSFINILSTRRMNPQVFADNLNLLISSMEINKTELARYLNYDPSYLCRICAGQRVPANMGSFVLKVSRFVTTRCKEKREKKILADLLECSLSDIQEDYNCQTRLLGWLGTRNILPENAELIYAFLQFVNDFEESGQSLAASVRNSSSSPACARKIYYGEKGMRLSELEFLEAAKETGTLQPVLLYSNFTNSGFYHSDDHYTKWLEAVHALVDKGADLKIILDMSVPFNHTAFQIQKWLPIYMTGHVTSYFLKDFSSSINGNLTFVSDRVALSGECIKGIEDVGKFEVIREMPEVDYYRRKATCLLEQASPLVEIYRADQLEQLLGFLDDTMKSDGSRYILFSSFPLYLIERDFLMKLITRRGLSADEQENILAFADRSRHMWDFIVERNEILTNFPVLTKDEFEKKPISLALSGMLDGKQITLTYDEYKECIQRVEALPASSPNFDLSHAAAALYPNIQITLHEGHYAIISKTSNPPIHFVIWHDKFINLLERILLQESAS